VVGVIDDLLLELAVLQCDIEYWPRSVPGFDVSAIIEAEEDVWFAFCRACYALESGQ
jgi:hypothetical protein